MTYPTIRPSLTLDFSKSKQLDPRITFSRSSTGTYVDGGVVKSAANNVARFEGDGLLIEESRTNLITYSQDLSNAIWQNVDCSWGTPLVTAPDGTATAQTPTITNSNNFTHTTSALVNGAFVSPNSTSTLTSSWRRDHITFTLGSGVTTITLYPLLNTGNPYVREDLSGLTAGGTYTLSGFYKKVGTTIYAWGIQFEQGSYPTSYIPTSGSTVTRSADVAELTADNFSNWYNNSEGTIFVDTKAASLTNTVVASLSTNSNNRMEIRSAGSSLTTSRFEVVESSANQFSSTITNNNTYRSLALGYKLNNTNAAANGTLGTLDTAFSVPAVDNLYLGNNIFATTQRPGHISRLSFYNQRLTDSQLQELTS